MLPAAGARERDLEDRRVRRAGQPLENPEARQRTRASPRAGHAKV